MAEVDFFITTNFQTVVRGAQGHPTGNMISRFVPWPMNYPFFSLQNTRKVIRLSVTKLQTHLTPPPAGRQLDWGAGCSTGTLPFKDKEKHTVGAHQKFQTLFLLFSLKPGRRLKRQKCGFFSQLHCFLLTSYYLFWDLWWYFPKNTLKAPC